MSPRTLSPPPFFPEGEALSNGCVLLHTSRKVSSQGLIGVVGGSRLLLSPSLVTRLHHPREFLTSGQPQAEALLLETDLS